ncbi:MAG: PAS domain S-box protein [Candidatus Zixiibacteriota bacterium]|nr:MAG: PAS domain S-box protein [candidate division Zixibacteria bacterium]
MAIRDQNKALKSEVGDVELCAAMVRLSSLALSKIDPDRIISEALGEIRKTLKAKMCWMFLVEENKTILKSLGDASSRRGPAKSELLLKLSPETVKRTYPIICNRTGELYKQNRVLHGFLRQRKIEKFIGVPLKKDGRSIGVLNVGRNHKAGDFTREDLRSLTALGSMLVISRLRAAEREYKHAQEFLEAVIDNIPNPIFIKDRRHRWVVLNEAICRLTGHPREKLLGKSDYDFFPKDQADFFWKKDEEMFRTGKVIDIPEEPINDKDGTTHYLHTKKAPLRDSGGKITHLVGIIEDITEHKQTEDALRESEEKYRLFVENIKEGIYSTRQGVFTGVNESMCRMFGYARQELIGMRAWNLAVPELRNSTRKMFFEKAAKQDYSPAEVQCLRKDGSVFVAEIRLSAISGKQQLLGIVSDITERERGEEALRESEKRYRALFRGAAEGILVADTKTRKFKYANPAICAILGYAEEELTRMSVPDLHPKDALEHVISEFEAQARKEKTLASDIPCLRKDGTIIYADVNTTRLLIDGRECNVGFFTDITERRRAEEALQRSEDRYRNLFEDSPISLWEEDFSGVKKYIDRLRNSGITDFRAYLESHPQAVAKCASMVKVTDVNKASLRLYGAKTKEELKSGLAQVFAAESYDPFREELIAIAEGKTVFEREALTRTLRGAKNHVSVKWTVPPGYEETLTKVVVAVTDITEAKEAEEALRREEERYRTLVETAQEGIGIVDAKENLVFVNRAFAGMLGYRKDELLGKNLQEISHGTQYDVFRQETKRRKQGQPSRYEITLLTRKRKPKPMYVSAAPLWNADGSFRGTLGVVSDLTEIKKVREYNVLLNASRSLSRTLKFDQVLKLGAEKMVQALNADRCTVMLPGDDTSGSSIRLRVYPFSKRGKVPASASSLKANKEHLSSYRRSLQAQGSVQIHNLHSDLVPNLGRSIVRKSGMVSALAVPMFLRNKMLVVFHVGMKRKARTFTTDEVRLARTMANQVAAALQNCKLMEDLRTEHSKIIQQSELLSTQYREQKMMFELTQALSSSRNLDQLLSSACRKVTELLNAERSSIGLLDPGGERATVRAVHVRGKPQPRDLVGFSFTAEEFPQLTDIVLLHKPFVVNDASLLPEEDSTKRYLSGQGMKSLIAQPLVYRGKSMGLLAVSSMTEARQFTKDEIRLLQTVSNPIAVTIENYRLLQDLKQKYAQIREQTRTLEKQTREQDILLTVSRALSRAMDLDEVSQVGSRVVGSALGADGCAVCLAGEDGQHFEIRGLYSREPAHDRKLLKTRFPWNDVPHLMKIIKKGKHFFIDNRSDLPSKSKTREYFRKTGIKTALGTGMFFGKKLVGLLSVTAVTQHRVFSQEETRLIQTMANQIAVAVENARLQQVVEKHAQDLKDLYSQSLKTQETERKKIAQELHDQVGQMLQSMKMNLDWMKRALTYRPEKLEKMEAWLSDTEKLLAQTIEDIRDLTFELRPSVLDDFGLIPGLEWYIDIYSRRSGVKVSLRTRDREYPFPPEVVTALYRIIQEALTNVAKHARASLASVSVSQRGSTAVLSVRDNGIGFDASKALSAPKGMGLLNIKERVNMLGGSFEIISRPRKGTKLNIQIPFSGGAV